MIGPRFDAAAHARRMRAEGFWVDKTYDEFLQKAIAATPDKLAIGEDGELVWRRGDRLLEELVVGLVDPEALCAHPASMGGGVEARTNHRVPSCSSRPVRRPLADFVS